MFHWLWFNWFSFDMLCVSILFDISWRKCHLSWNQCRFHRFWIANKLKMQIKHINVLNIISIDKSYFSSCSMQMSHLSRLKHIFAFIVNYLLHHWILIVCHLQQPHGMQQPTLDWFRSMVCHPSECIPEYSHLDWAIADMDMILRKKKNKIDKHKNMKVFHSFTKRCLFHVSSSFHRLFIHFSSLFVCINF